MKYLYLGSIKINISLTDLDTGLKMSVWETEFKEGKEMKFFTLKRIFFECKLYENKRTRVCKYRGGIYQGVMLK